MHSKLLVAVVVGWLGRAAGDCMVTPNNGGDKIDISALDNFNGIMAQGGNNALSNWEINWCKELASGPCGTVWNAPGFIFQSSTEGGCGNGDWVFQKMQSQTGGDGDPIMLIYEDTYHTEGGKAGGTFSITIECDQGGTISKLTGLSDPPHIDDNWPSEPERLTMSFKGKIACKGAAAEAKAAAEEKAGGGDEGGSDAGGWVFVGIVLGGLAIYFAAGYAFNYKKKELRGKEAIPHLTFWMDLPYLVKDGAQFAFTQISGGINKVRGK